MGHKPVSIEVEGMTCVNCARSVEKYLKGKGFTKVKVNFATKDVSFLAEDDSYSPREVAREISALGYRMVTGNNKSNVFPLGKRIIIASLLTLPLFLGHMLMPLGIHAMHWLHDSYVQLILATPVFVIGLLQFGRSSYAALKQGTIHMDVLILMGSSAAFFYSVAGTLSGNPDMIFYETAAMIITLVLVGNYLEQRAVRQTTTAIEALSKLKPSHAFRYENGQLVKVDTAALVPGNIIQVNEGDSLPADGKVMEGEGYVDESMLTGESIPVAKKPGDKVVGASVVGRGQMTVEVEATGEATVLSNIIKMVKNAQADKPDIQRLADKISAVFVPLVIGIAILTFTVSVLAFDISYTRALMNSIAVLVISCPCAMGLATPTAVMVGVGRVARQGILIRGGSTLEEFADTRYMLFDKTGTLTTGAFRTGRINYNGNDPRLVNALLYRMEEKSSHPIATALRDHIAGQGEIAELPVALTEISEEGGRGMKAVDTDGNVYTLGSPLMTENGNSSEYDVVLCQNDRFIAGFNMNDDIKPHTADTIHYLKSLGITPVIISGDREDKVKAIAGELGITEWYAARSPQDKLKLVDEYRSRGKTGFVGDGINDAPALARADLGVSLSNASEVAIQSSRIILLGGDMAYLKQAMAVSRATLTTIRQNLGWAFSYNIVAIPMAAMGYLNPMWAALFMAFSDIVVIGNSIRLKFRKVLP